MKRSLVILLFMSACFSGDDETGRNNSPPSVSFVTPQDNATVTGTVTVELRGVDDEGIVSLELFLDGELKDSSNAAILIWEWDTTQVQEGSHELRAVAIDTGGRRDTASIRVRVDNITEDMPPEVEFLSPEDGAEVSGSVSVMVRATDDTGIEMVDLLVDGSMYDTDKSAPFQWTWETTAIPNGIHTLTAVASDTFGQSSTAEIGVRVAN